MSRVKQDFPTLVEGMEFFQSTSKQICDEYETLDKIGSINCLIWELLKLPKVIFLYRKIRL